MAFAEYSEYDGLGLAELVRRGEISAPRQRIYEMLFEELSRPRW